MSKQEKSLRITEQQFPLPITLPIVQGNKDYREHKEILENIDRLLTQSGIEIALQEQELKKSTGGSQKNPDKKRLSTHSESDVTGHAMQYYPIAQRRVFS